MRCIPLTHAQEAMWALQSTQPSNPGLLIRAVLQLSEGAEPRRIEHAVHLLFQRHPLLRAVVGSTGGIPCLRIMDNVPCPFEAHVLADGLPSTRDHAIAVRSIEPFDLQRGPLVRFCLLRCRNGPAAGNILLVVMHHIIGDFSSLDLVVRELEANYATDAVTATRRPPAWSWEGDAERQRADADGAQASASIAYWRERFGAVLAPCSSSAALVAPGCRGLESCEPVDALLTASLRGAALRHGVGLPSLMLGAFAVAAYGSQDRAILCIAVDLRTREAQRDCIGMYTNTVPVILEIAQAGSIPDLASQADAEVRSAVIHRKLPFSVLINALRTVHLHAAADACRTLFSWVRYDPAFARGAAAIVEDTLRMEGPQTCGVASDLSLRIADRGDRLECLWAWNPHVHGDSVRMRTMPRFREALVMLAHEPEGSMARLRGAGARRERATL